MTPSSQATQPIRNRTEESFSDPEEYRQALLKCYLAIQFMAGLELDRLAEAQEQADTLGPILDPTLWRQNHRKLDEDKSVVKALRAALAALPRSFIDQLVARRSRADEAPPFVLPGCPQCGSGIFESLERDVWACRSGACGWRGPKP